MTTCHPADERLEALVDDAMSIPGFLHREECRALIDAAVSSRGDIVEIGAWQGRSTSLLAAAIKGSERSRRLFVIDNYVVPPGVKYFRGSPQLLFGNLARFDLSPDVFLRMTSAEAARQLNLAPGMVFIDADHRREQLECDVESWCYRLHPGSCVAFHDYRHPRWPDVQMCVDEWLARMGRRVRVIALVDRLLLTSVEEGQT